MLSNLLTAPFPLPSSLLPSLPLGLDGKAFREISMEQTASKMEQLPEMMHFIEKDPSLAQVFKDRELKR